MCVPICGGRRTNLCDPPQSLSMLLFEVGTLIGTWCLQSSWLQQEIQRSPGLHLSTAGITGVCHRVQLFTPGTKLWSPCFQDKCFGNRTISALFSPFSIVNLSSNMNSGFNKIVFNKHGHYFFFYPVSSFLCKKAWSFVQFCSKYDEGDDKERENKPGAGGIEYGFSFLCCILWQRLHQRRNNLVNFRPCFPFSRLNCQFSVHPSLTMLCKSILTLRKDSFHNIFAWHNSVIRAVCKALLSLISFTREQLAVWRIFNAAVTQHSFCCGFCLGTCKVFFFFNSS